MSRGVDAGERDQGRLFGIEIASAGDVDRDGVADLLIADPSDPEIHGEPSWEGRVWLLSGGSGRLLLTLRGRTRGSALGTTLCGPGDLDGDGVPDLLASAPSWDCGGETPDPSSPVRGYVAAFSGRTSDLLYEIEVPPAVMGQAWFSSVRGPALCAIGDVDDDRTPDFAVGSALDSNECTRAGAVRIVSGRSGRMLRTFRGTRAGERLGTSLCAIEDVDGDDRADLVVGAGGGDAVVILSSVSGAVLRRFASPWTKTKHFGASLAVIGDIDGDGGAEIAIGHPFFEPLDDDGVFVRSATDGRRLFESKRRGDDDGHSFGAEIVALPDVDDDHVPDLAVSAPVPNDPEGGAGVWILSGKDGREIRSITDNSGSHFGVSMVEVGDFNGDGHPDLAIGSASVRGRCFPGFVGVYVPRNGVRLRHWSHADLDGRK